MPNQYSMFTGYGEVLTEDVVCYKKLAKHFHRCYDVFCDMTNLSRRRPLHQAADRSCTWLGAHNGRKKRC